MYLAKHCIYLVLFFALLFTHQTWAQLDWQRIDGPPGGYCTVSAGVNGELVALNTTIGIYSSSDGGNFWKFRAFPGSWHTEASFIKGTDAQLWFFNRDVLYQSVDNSRTWTEILPEGSKWVENDMVASVILENGSVMIGVRSTGIIRSVDSSKTLTTVLPITGGLNALAHNPLNGHLYAWRKAPTTGQINKIYRSTDRGLTWAIWENDALLTGLTINGLGFAPNGNIMLLTTSKAFRSTNDGATWVDLNRRIDELCISPTGRMFVVDATNQSQNDYVYSDDDGDTWQALPQRDMRKLTVSPDGTLFGEYAWESLYRSEDNGMTWQFSAYGMAHFTLSSPAMYYDKTDLSALAITDDGLFYSPNSSTHWQLRHASLTDSAQGYVSQRSAMLSDGTFFYFFNKRLQKTTDKGLTWTDATPAALTNANDFDAIRIVDDVLFFVFDLGSDLKTLRSADGGQTWQDLGNLQVQALKKAPNGTFWAFNYGSQVQKSTDRGFTWTPLTNISLSWPTEIIIFPNGAIVIIDNDKVYRSVNDGVSWTITPIPLSSAINRVSSVRLNSAGHLFFIGTGTLSGELYISLDEGQTFQYMEEPDSYWADKFLYMTPDQHLVFVSGDGAWRSTEVSSDFLTIRGNGILDVNYNCIGSFSEPRVNQLLVKATAANGQVSYGMSNEAGEFHILAKPGTYQMTSVAPNQLWSACDTSVTIPANITSGTVFRNVAVKASVLCPQLDVSVGAPFLRRCFNMRMTVNYANTGTIPAQNARILVVLDPYLNLLSSTHPIAQQSGDSLYFDLGTVAVNFRSAFYLDVNVSCDAALGQMHCTSAKIYPDTICSTWQGPLLKTEASCLGDSILLQIKNEGKGGMSTQQTWQLWRGTWTNFDSSLVAEGGFMLAPGQVYTTKIAADQTTGLLYFKVPQAAGYPFGSGFAQTVLLHCNSGATLPPYSFEYQVYEPTKDRFCMTNIGSFDPNDKRGTPEGIGAGHHIDKSEPLDYMIRFQNTGTDTAFTVVIRDTLSPWLNLESVQFGGSSHPCVMNVRGTNELVFTFNNIMLPDSNINELASHGFVRYSIRQKTNNLDGTEIKNRAAIYFDFNAPVITNETVHTIGLPKVSRTHDVHNPEKLRLVIWPNPISGAFWVDTPDAQLTGKHEIEITDPAGRILMRRPYPNGPTMLERMDTPAGLVFIRLLNTAGTVIAVEKAVVVD